IKGSRRQSCVSLGWVAVNGNAPRLGRSSGRLAMLEEADRRGGQFAARNPATPNLAEQSEARIAPDESSGLGGRGEARPFGSRARVLSNAALAIAACRSLARA